VAAWAAIQFADVVVPNLNGPQWIITAVIVAAAVGLPAVLVLAWIFDWRPDGVHRTADQPRVEGDGIERGGVSAAGRASEAAIDPEARAHTAPWVVAVAVLVVGIGSAIVVAALLVGGGGEAGADRGNMRGAPDGPPEIRPPGGFVDAESIQSRVARDLEQIRGLGDLGPMAGLARLGDLDSMDLDELLEVVAGAADEAGMTVLLQEPAAWRLGRTQPVTLPEGDTLVVRGLARDTAGVASVSIDGVTAARADEPAPNLRFTGRVVGTRSSGSSQVTIRVRTADGREIQREYPVSHVPARPDPAGGAP